ncbi:MAG: hypothetical protein ACRD1L_03565 [Terriglobales bacterium]
MNIARKTGVSEASQEDVPPPRVPSRDQVLAQLSLDLFQPRAFYDPVPLLHRLRVAALLLRYSYPPARSPRARSASDPHPPDPPSTLTPPGYEKCWPTARWTRSIPKDELRAHARIAHAEQLAWKPTAPFEVRPHFGLPDFALLLDDCICQTHPACAPATPPPPPDSS